MPISLWSKNIFSEISNLTIWYPRESFSCTQSYVFLALTHRTVPISLWPKNKFSEISNLKIWYARESFSCTQFLEDPFGPLKDTIDTIHTFNYTIGCQLVFIPQYVNTFGQEQNGCCFADNTLKYIKYIFMKKKPFLDKLMLIKFLLKFVCVGPFGSEQATITWTKWWHSSSVNKSVTTPQWEDLRGDLTELYKIVRIRS